MTPERWKQVEELYNAASAKPRDEQAAFLAEVCVDDEELRREVESLLQFAVSPGGPLSGPAAAMADEMTSGSVAGAMTGASIGGYRLQALLGAGGMGEVYRSRDVKLERDVAIKILPTAFANDPDRLARFEREARMLAALTHPNICAIFGLEESEGIRFLVLEFVEGATLRETLKNITVGTGFPLRIALDTAKQIADALEVAHEKGIIHRDLKPTNVMITPDGVVKVLDFGLAKSVRDERSLTGLKDVTVAPDNSRQGGAVMGTAAYMSPEQARGQTVDKRTDIWAFGCVLYEMLTGRVPFAADTASDTIAKILERDPDWTALPAETPAHIRRLLVRCLAKDPKQRLRDIGDVRIEIDAALDPTRASSEITTMPARRRRKWLPWVALVAFAAGAGMWGGRLTSHAPINPAPPPLALASPRFTRITNWPGNEGGAVFSHDGRFVVFVADKAGETDVWLTQLDARNEKFTNLTEKLPPVGSPGPILGGSIGFNATESEIWFSPREERGINASNVPTERKQLVDLIDKSRIRSFLETDVESLSWSPDPVGKYLAFFTTNTGPDVLFVADSTGADRRELLAKQEGGMHNHSPVWSQDLEWIYYVHGKEPTGKMAIMRVRRTGGDPELLFEQTGASYLAVLNNDTLLYIARAEDRSGPWLWALDIPSKKGRRVNTGVDPITSVSASTNGRRVVVTVAKPSAALWRVPLLLNGLAHESDVRPYPITGRALAPRFSEKSLLYLSSQGAPDALWQSEGGGREGAELWRGENVLLSEPVAVSRQDGRIALVAYDKQSGKRRLMITAADGSDPRTLTSLVDVKGAANQGLVDWSPDGKSIVAGGVNAKGVTGLFLVPLDGGDPKPLVEKTGTNPVSSPSEDLIVYASKFERGQVTLSGVRSDGTPVEIRHLTKDEKGERKLDDVRTRQGGYRFLPDGKLMFVTTASSPDFWVLDLITKEAKKVAELNDNRGRQITFDVSPDGKYIVFDRIPENSDIYMIEF